MYLREANNEKIQIKGNQRDTKTIPQIWPVTAILTADNR